MTNGPADRIQDQWLARLKNADAYNRWVFSQFAEHLGPEVLEVGCGHGTFTALLAARGLKVHAIDIDAASVAAVRRTVDVPNVQVEQADITRTIWKERFDAIVMLDVLEHIEDDMAILARMGDALLPGGRFVAKVPAMPSLYGAQDRAVGHYRRYTAPGLDRMMRTVGFAEVRCWHFNAASTVGWWLNGRLLGRAAPPSAQITVFEALLPLAKKLDFVARFGLGLSLFVVGMKPH